MEQVRSQFVKIEATVETNKRTLVLHNQFGTVDDAIEALRELKEEMANIR